jgi:acetyl-CoA acetyltransferase
MDLRGQAAIIGIGDTPFVRHADESALALAAQAFKAALADAGATRDDVDGLATHYGSPIGVDYDRFAEAMGLNIRHAAQYWNHGRFVTTTLQQAALTVIAGLADVIAVVTSVKFLSVRAGLGGDKDRENAREGGGTHGEEPTFGLTSPAGGAALTAQAYMERYGYDRDMLFDVVRSSRAHAARNPRAMRREPFDAEVYAEEPLVIEPLRRADCALLSDGAVVVLVTRADQVDRFATDPVPILGMQGMRAGPDEFCFAPRGFGVLQQGVGDWPAERYPNQVFDMAGVGPADIDGFYTYDAFSPLVPFALERFGHFPAGESPKAIADGVIAPGGALPVNTHGGLLSEAHIGGWNHMAEMVRQLRGQAGPTQIDGARLLQWGTAWGDSVILGSAS